MSTINEQIVTGRAHRVLIDKVAKLWQRISFWTKASDVEFNDGNTAETKVGAIKGITTDLNTTETGYAADMTALAQLNSDMQLRVPDYTNVIIPSASNRYIVPFDGYAIISCSVASTAAYFYASINEVIVASFREPSANSNVSGEYTTTIPVRKNDIITTSDNSAYVSSSVKFVPFLD